jgi:PIN domain nuclease of toxin-antitoxin system
MRLLLDTHAFLWFITADAQLSSTAENAIRNPGNDAFLSIASVWEIAIKVNLGKLPIPLPLDTFIPEQLRLNRVSLLPIEMQHAFEVSRMAPHHRDPFDRMIIAQAQVERLELVSADAMFDPYPIRRLW